MWFFSNKRREEEVNKRRNRSEGIVTEQSRFVISEAYRTIRTNIMFSLPGEPVDK